MDRWFMVGKEYSVYIMTNSNNTVLYTGVTNWLQRRAYEHRNELGGILQSNTTLPSWFITK